MCLRRTPCQPHGLTRGRKASSGWPFVSFCSFQHTTPAASVRRIRVFDRHHSIINHLFSHTTQRPPRVCSSHKHTSLLRQRHKEEAAPQPHLPKRSPRTRPSPPVRLHARRALAHALPPTATTADLTHLFRTPPNWSSTFNTY